MRTSNSIRFIALVIFALNVVTQAQLPGNGFRGAWAATASTGRSFQGTWTGQASQENPDWAGGSWQIFDTDRRFVLEGTWSAQKKPAGWTGTWTAKTLDGRTVSGTWRTINGALAGNAFQDMLQAAMKKQIAGTWYSGQYRGRWQLKGAE